MQMPGFARALPPHLLVKLHDDFVQVNRSFFELVKISGGRYKQMNFQRRCPRCGEAKLLSWGELTDEQREVVRRLPGSAEVKSSIRESTHRWCPRCWFESTHDTEVNA